MPKKKIKKRRKKLSEDIAEISNKLDMIEDKLISLDSQISIKKRNN